MEQAGPCRAIPAVAPRVGHGERAQGAVGNVTGYHDGIRVAARERQNCGAVDRLRTGERPRDLIRKVATAYRDHVPGWHRRRGWRRGRRRRWRGRGRRRMRVWRKRGRGRGVCPSKRKPERTCRTGYRGDGLIQTEPRRTVPAVTPRVRHVQRAVHAVCDRIDQRASVWRASRQRSVVAA